MAVLKIDNMRCTLCQSTQPLFKNQPHIHSHLSAMHYTRLYTDDQGETRFEEVTVPLQEKGMIGYLSKKFPVSSVQFRENRADYDWGFHNAPARQFIVLLDGEIEITTSLNEKRRFVAGDVLLVEDTEGKGHKTRNVIQKPRHSLFIELD